MKTLAVVLALALPLSAETVVRDAIQPCLAQDKDGGFVCAFIRGGNIEIATSADGKSWSQPVMAIDCKGMAQGGRQRGPRVGVDDKKNVTVSAPVCLDESKRGEKFRPTELYLAVSTDGGKTFAAPLQVNEVRGEAMEALHWLRVAPDGAAHLVWMDGRAGKGQEVWYAKVAGGKAGRNLKVSPPACPCCAPGLGVDGKGNPTVIWREMSEDGSREIYVAISRDGGTSFGAPVRVNRRDSNIPD